MPQILGRVFMGGRRNLKVLPWPWMLSNKKASSLSFSTLSFCLIFQKSREACDFCGLVGKSFSEQVII